MKITIDTKQDSRDEIRKIVRLLNELLEMKHDNHHLKNAISGHGDNYGHNAYGSNYNSLKNNQGQSQYPHQNVQGYNTYGSSDFQNHTSQATNSMNSTNSMSSMSDSQGFFNMFDTSTPNSTASTMGMSDEQNVPTENVEKKKVDPAEFEIYEY